MRIKTTFGRGASAACPAGRKLAKARIAHANGTRDIEILQTLPKTFADQRTVRKGRRLYR
jgi:hypothetical protein